MDEKSLNLWRQIERCRRIANVTTDDEEHEAKMPAGQDSFMLGAAPRREQPQPAVKRPTSR